MTDFQTLLASKSKQVLDEKHGGKNTILFQNSILTNMPFSSIISLVGVFLISVIFFFYQASYIPTVLTSWLGIVLLPFVTRPTTVHRGGKWLYLVMIIVFSLVNLSGQSATFYYLLFVGIILFWLDTTRYRLNYLPLLMLIVLAPIFRNLVFTWSFPIRIKMSEWVGEVLTWMGKDAVVSGNMIVMDGIEFSVDPACTGLKMMSIAMILGLFIFAHYERQFKKTLALIPAILGLGFVLSLTIFANFSRLLALVLFHVMPEHFLHTGIGLLSLVVYVLLPVYFLASYYVQTFGRQETSETQFSILNTKKSSLLLLSFSVLLCFFGLKRQAFHHPKDMVLESIQLDNFQKTVTENKITKLVNEDILIYLKPPVGAFGGAHDPRYCWQGSGYEFKHIHPVLVENTNVYWATLVRDNDEIVTAWWYENATQRTISEWEWRWQSLSGSSPYRLVNISARDEETLKMEVQRFLQKDLFQVEN